MPKRVFLPIALAPALLACRLAAASPLPAVPSLESAIETQSDRVTLPTAPGEALGVLPCPTCARLSIPTDATTRWQNGSLPVTLAELRALLVGSPRPTGVFLNRATGHVSRVQIMAAANGGH